MDELSPSFTRDDIAILIERAKDGIETAKELRSCTSTEDLKNHRGVLKDIMGELRDLEAHFQSLIDRHKSSLRAVQNLRRDVENKESDLKDCYWHMKSV